MATEPRCKFRRCEAAPEEDAKYCFQHMFKCLFKCSNRVKNEWTFCEDANEHIQHIRAKPNLQEFGDPGDALKTANEVQVAVVNEFKADMAEHAPKGVDADTLLREINSIHSVARLAREDTALFRDVIDRGDKDHTTIFRKAVNAFEHFGLNVPQPEPPAGVFAGVRALPSPAAFPDGTWACPCGATHDAYQVLCTSKHGKFRRPAIALTRITAAPSSVKKTGPMEPVFTASQPAFSSKLFIALRELVAQEQSQPIPGLTSRGVWHSRLTEGNKDGLPVPSWSAPASSSEKSPVHVTKKRRTDSSASASASATADEEGFLRPVSPKARAQKVVTTAEQLGTARLASVLSVWLQQQPCPEGYKWVALHQPPVGPLTPHDKMSGKEPTNNTDVFVMLMNNMAAPGHLVFLLEAKTADKTKGSAADTETNLQALCYRHLQAANSGINAPGFAATLTYTTFKLYGCFSSFPPEAPHVGQSRWTLLHSATLDDQGSPAVSCILHALLHLVHATQFPMQSDTRFMQSHIVFTDLWDDLRTYRASPLRIDGDTNDTNVYLLHPPLLSKPDVVLKVYDYSDDRRRGIDVSQRRGTGQAALDVLQGADGPYLPGLQFFKFPDAWTLAPQHFAAVRYDFVEGTCYPQHLEQFAQPFQCLCNLHSHPEKFVHGDVRVLNMVFPSDEKKDAVLIDFDFAGKEGDVYPTGYTCIDRIRERHPKAKGGRPKKCVHDLYALLKIVCVSCNIPSVADLLEAAGCPLELRAKVGQNGDWSADLRPVYTSMCHWLSDSDNSAMLLQPRDLQVAIDNLAQNVVTGSPDRAK